MIQAIIRLGNAAGNGNSRVDCDGWRRRDGGRHV